MPPDEKTKLVNKKDKGKNSEPYNVLDDHGDSFVHPRTTEQKCFVVFLVFMIVCLLALSFVIILDSSPTKRQRKQMELYDVTADTRLHLLNSLYHEKSTMESGCESTLLLMRHCEKYPDDGVENHGGNHYCTWLGRERAYFLPSLFDPTNPNRRWPVPAKIFALTEERDSADDDSKNYREIESVMPLANKFGLEVEVYPFNVEELAADYFELLQSGEMCGKVTVVAWKHEFIKELALALACGPNEGCPSVYPDDSFDEVWQMKYVFDPHGAAKTSRDPMKLPVETQGPLSLFEPTNAELPINALDDDDDDDDDYAPSAPNRQLQLRRELKHKKQKKRGKWVVYGTKTYQYFDPLAFSLQSGDYPPEGSPKGGKWADEI